MMEYHISHTNYMVKVDQARLGGDELETVVGID